LKAMTDASSQFVCTVTAVAVPVVPIIPISETSSAACYMTNLPPPDRLLSIFGGPSDCEAPILELL
jgi:hypothetical protein